MRRRKAIATEGLSGFRFRAYRGMAPTVRWANAATDALAAAFAAVACARSTSVWSAGFFALTALGYTGGTVFWLRTLFPRLGLRWLANATFICLGVRCVF